MIIKQPASSFQYRDSDLPEASFAGGSHQTASVASGIAAPAEKVLKELFDLAADSFVTFNLRLYKQQ